MKRALSATFVCVILWTLFAGAQTPPPTKDVLGAHDLSGASTVKGPNANACIYCHAPHGGADKTLWNQTLSNQNYTLYTSGSGQNMGAQPAKLGPSSQCLSCHDGTVAVGQTIAVGTLQMSGSMTSKFGTHLEGSHPFSMQLPLKDAANLVSTIASDGTTKDPAVKLVSGNVECNTCHEPHNQYIDKKAGNFLVRDNIGSAICLACHETGARTVNGSDNSLTQWVNSVHAKSTAAVASKAWSGPYTTIAEYACANCHVSHNAAGPGLMRLNANRPPNVDDTAQNCYVCHDGSTNMVEPLLNVLADFQKLDAHPYTDSNNQHVLGEAIIAPDNNRHSTCSDCHNSHAANPTNTFTDAPGLRPSQNGVAGVAVDGTAVKTATNQYENCLRCHSSSGGKQSLASYGYMPARAMFAGDTLNVLLQFNNAAISQHPVMRDAKRLNQPSLLNYMWDISGTVQKRAMSTRILCTDCHNSDTNRESGGAGANGPHGSKNDHILERQYVISRVDPTSGPGSPVVNLTPNPALDPTTSLYAMCAKCHDLTNINSDATFAEHKRHINLGFSCSVCHSAHGVPAGSTGTVGTRLVSFDMNVVAPQNGIVSYNGTGCNLMCHGRAHEQN